MLVRILGFLLGGFLIGHAILKPFLPPWATIRSA